MQQQLFLSNRSRRLLNHTPLHHSLRVETITNMYANTKMPNHKTVLNIVVSLPCAPMCNQVETPAQHQEFIENYGVARSIMRRLKREILVNSGALDGAQGDTHDLTNAISGIAMAFSKHRRYTQVLKTKRSINLKLTMDITYTNPVQKLYVVIYGVIVVAHAATKNAWTSTTRILSHV